MLVSLADIEDLLQNPASGAPVRLRREAGVVIEATATDAAFPVMHGQPVLIDFAASIVPREWFREEREVYSLIGKRCDLPRAVKGWLFGTAAISRRNFRALRRLLEGAPSRHVLMVGAGQKGMGSDLLYDDPAISLIAFDVYPSPLTVFSADAHRIPLQDRSVDAVCVQAVLEHVLDPARVVSEIYRVLKPGGYVYAETPFMQQVHEGAYDFTRFTELGHRWLFRDFDVLDRGPIGGPGLSVYWAMKYFFRGLTRSRMAANVLSLPFGVLALFDRFMPAGHLIDGANGVYFLGRKSETGLQASGIAAAYEGAQR
ncbi:MAG TPA: class I SAM-dependent methyltransferase [Parvibaculum sp.]|jgi:SAM-dependent methyltransferase